MDRDLSAMQGGSPTFLLDGRPYRAVGEEMTGAQILALAGLEPEDADLYAEGHHALHIPAEDSVVVQEGSRFVTRPRP